MLRTLKRIGLILTIVSGIVAINHCEPWLPNARRSTRLHASLKRRSAMAIQKTHRGESARRCPGNRHPNQFALSA
jgi:hypothetical protein